jgi:hypothetical protein
LAMPGQVDKVPLDPREAPEGFPARLGPVQKPAQLLGGEVPPAVPDVGWDPASGNKNCWASSETVLLRTKRPHIAGYSLSAGLPAP